MALLDIFRKKKKEEEIKEKKAEKVEKPKRVERPEIIVAAKPKTKKKEEIKTAKPQRNAAGILRGKPKAKTKISDRAFYILKQPHITEKATALTEKNQYIFNVFAKANKPEVKKAVEGLYGVEVVAVRIVNIPAKKRRLGRISGWKPGYKKAIIKIKEGQKIEVLPR